MSLLATLFTFASLPNDILHSSSQEMCPAHLDIHSSKRVVWITHTAAGCAAGAPPGLEGCSTASKVMAGPLAPCEGRKAAELGAGVTLGHHLRGFS